MKKFIILISIFLTSIIFSLSESQAVRESRPTSRDSRLRVITYSPDDVFKYTGYYGYQASIELSDNENVVSISMGDTTGWQIVPSGNRIFLKPMEVDATTNMTLITNKRTYFFELYASDAEGLRDPEMVFNVKFIYPDENESESIKSYNSKISGPDLSHPENYNFNYSLTGADEISPVNIFDDGEFTYLVFRDKNFTMPAIFAVSADLRESKVNFHLSSTNQNMIIVEQVFPKLSLRLDSKIVCVYNDSYKE